MKKFITLFFMFLSLCACAASDGNAVNGANVNYNLAVNSQASNSPVNTKYVPVPVPGQMMPIPSKKSSGKTSSLTGEEAVTTANRKASQMPSSSHYINSIMTFDYMTGALYQIYSAPLRVTDIQFQNSEHIISVGAGDTLRWQVSKTFSGTGLNRAEHLLIKPTEEGLTNSLVVTTDQRTYHLMLHSTANTYMASVAWHYPEGDGFLEKFDDGEAGGKGGDYADVGVNINSLDFRYKIKLVKGPTPDWYPRMAFTDGKKTYIMLPTQMQEAPTLFVGNSTKTNQIVNYRVQGNYYVLDGVFGQIQLRSGQEGQIVVQISYTAN